MRSVWRSAVSITVRASRLTTGAGAVEADRSASRAVSLCVLALVLCGCRTPPGAASAAVAAATAAAEAAPTLRFGQVEEYPGERLYDFMDGAAVTYLEHHCRTLAAAAVFRGADQAKIELYELASPADAMALYAELTGSPGTPFAAGEAGCCWAGFEPEVLFRRGRFLVRLLGYARDREAAMELLAKVAAAIDGQLRER